MTAVGEFGRQRNDLTGRLFGLQNLFTLIDTVSIAVTTIVITFYIISFVFRVEVKDIVLGLSSIMLSVAFATGCVHACAIS